MTVRLIDLPSQAPKPREKLFEFLRGHDRILYELVDHGRHTAGELTIGPSAGVVCHATCFAPGLAS